MRDYSAQNKKAWEFNAYDFWIKYSGTPEEMAKKNLENPKKMLRKYAGYFDKFDGVRIALCKHITAETACFALAL